jgi:predicted O-methyltransferase YrrM
VLNNRSLNLDDNLYQYLLDISVKEHPVLRALREETYKSGEENFQSSPEQAQFMAFLVKLLNVEKMLEIGVFKGYSTLAFALALPESGKVFACDNNKEWTDIGSHYWQKAGIDHKINLYLAPALETMNDLIAQGHSNSFDLAFIDADKRNYDSYYEYSLKLVKPGGLILIDNTLWYGKVAEPSINDKQTLSIRNLNEKLKDDTRVDISMLPIRDGLTLVRKK